MTLICLASLAECVEFVYFDFSLLIFTVDREGARSRLASSEQIASERNPRSGVGVLRSKSPGRVYFEAREC